MLENVRIIRIDFGGKKFITKEELWPYLGEYIENMLVFYKNESRLPNFVTSHYGDGGIAGAIFSMQTNMALLGIIKLAPPRKELRIFCLG